MKKIVSLALVLIMGMQFSNAQTTIDRSKQPEAGPAPIISIQEPAIFKLNNGITVLVVENHKLPKVSASFNIDRGPVLEGKNAGVVSLMGAMLEEGTTTMNKETFDKKVGIMGSNVNLSASGGFVSSLTRYFDESFMLFADALKNPAFPAASFDKLKSLTLTGLKSAEKSTDAIAGRVLGALSFGKNTAMGEFETEASINALTLNDVKEAYKKYVTPSRAYLTFVGDITAAEAKKIAEKAFGNWKGATLSYPNIADVSNVSKTEINFVDVPTAVQSQIYVTNLIKNPLSNPDYFALSLANQILGGGFEGKLFMNLREKHGFTYGSYSSVGNGRLQTQFSGNAQVRNEKVDSAVAEMIKEINNMRAGNFTQADLDLAKAKYNGSFALAMENPARTASYATDILINSLPKDYYRNFLKNINAVTLADVKRVSQKYFDTDHARIIIVGKGETVLPNLARLNYSIKNFDAYANPIDMEALKKEAAASSKAAANVSADQVIENYLKTIGGKSVLEKINSMTANVSMEMMGQTMGGTIKKMVPYSNYMELTMNGMVVFKQVFDGTKGYQGQMGQNKDMEADQIEEQKEDKGIFNQLYYHETGYKLEMAGTSKLNGEDSYKLKVTKPSGSVSTEYYSIKTGLLLRQESTIEAQGQSIDQATDFGNYVAVAGIMTPTKITQVAGGQEMPMTLSDIKFNAGLTADDFK